LLSIKENLKKHKEAIKRALSLGSIMLATLICSSFLFLAIIIPLPNNLKSPVTLLLKPGYSSHHIADILQQNNVIRSKWFFLLYVKVIATNKKLIAGEYEFLPKKSLKQIVTEISKGESIVRKITIPEGLSSKQIVDLLNNEPRLSGSISEIPKEGTLFPDTYKFKYGDLRTRIIKAMEDKMTDTIAKLQPRIPKNGLIRNVDDLIKLASIVEKEAANDSEKPLVASVFLNRLKKKMKLQADPTIIYGITMGSNNLGRELSKKDLETDAPYNSYTNFGLPPTPIACPGLKALEAVLKPAQTNYLYFVVNGSGGHSFSSNLSDHNNNVKNYRELQKKK